MPKLIQRRGHSRAAGDRVDMVLGSELAWYENFQGVAYPPPHFMLIFVGDSEEEEHQAASKAAARVSQPAGRGLRALACRANAARP
jgi:hypothetical protein